MKSNPADDPSAERYAITPDYFRVMTIPLRAGRLFTNQDDGRAQLVMIVSETSARAFWPGQNPVGQLVRIGDPVHAPWRTVVGVVGDVHHEDLTEAPLPAMYLPQSQNTDSFLVLVVKSAGADPSRLVAPIRGIFKELDPAVPIYDVATMDERLAKAIADYSLGGQSRIDENAASGIEGFGSR